MYSVFSKLMVIQGRLPSVIHPGDDLYDGRRGFTTIATDLGFKAEEISLICQWQTQRDSGGRAKFQSMVATYTDYKQAKPARIKILKVF